MFKIEKGIPIPMSRETGLTAAIRKLKVGDSFVVTRVQRAQCAASGNRLGFKLATRNAEGGVRVWRIA